MAAHRQELLSKAVERARALCPDRPPDSAEIVQLARDQAFVVVRTLPSGVVVLDRAGRLVKGRPRLLAIARHAEAVRRFDRAITSAALPVRHEHALEGMALLRAESRGLPRRPAAAVRSVIASLGALSDALDGLLAVAVRQAESPPTRRTLPRAVGLLNAAAAADRAVVNDVRSLGAEIATVVSDAAPRPPDRLLRWVVGRLASEDLPFFFHELHAASAEERAAAFVAAAAAAGR